MRSSPLLHVVGSALLLAGCGWPRYSNLPDDSDVFDAADDPRGLVDATWTEMNESALLAAEGADNGDPRNVTPTSLDALEGLQVAGSLRGIGWNSTFDAPTLQADGCDDASRSPGGDGDWSGDVDFVVVDVGEATNATLCAHVVMDDPDLGWDLLLYPLDACGLPRAPLTDPNGGGLLGLLSQGATGGWRAPVESGQRYGVLLAGYDAAEPVAEYDYHLGVALVTGAEGRELCPLLPVEQGGAE